jgi:hypothetical protein
VVDFFNLSKRSFSAQSAAAAVLIPRRHEEADQSDWDQTKHNAAEEGFDH